MITEDFVSVETAKLLKEKGFDEAVRCFYDIRTEILCDDCVKTKNSYTESIAAPTLQMAIKWLREVYNLYIEMKISKNTFLWGFRVSLSNGSTSYSHANVFSNYEQACEAAIKYCLENLI